MVKARFSSLSFGVVCDALAGNSGIFDLPGYSLEVVSLEPTYGQAPPTSAMEGVGLNSQLRKYLHANPFPASRWPDSFMFSMLVRDVRVVYLVFYLFPLLFFT